LPDDLVLKEIRDAIIAGEIENVKDLIESALKNGIDPFRILNKGLVDGVREVGRRFEEGSFFLPDLIMAGNAMDEGSKILQKVFEKEKRLKPIGSLGKALICTVKDDIHDIGKNIVVTLLRVEGYEVFDLGKDVSTEEILEKVAAWSPDIAGLSALLTTTMPRQREVITALKKARLREKVKVMIGGAPTTDEWAEEIGADGWAPDAVSAVRKANELISMAREFR